MTWEPRLTVIVILFDESGSGEVLAPSFMIEKAAIAIAAKSLLVVSPRVGAEQDTTGFQGRMQLSQYPREWAWPLRDDLHNWICVIEEMEKISLSDQHRLHEIGKFLDKELDFDVA